MFRRFLKYYEFRSFSNSSIRTNLEKAKPAPPPEPAKPPTSNSTGVVGMDFIPSDFEKKILVWSGRYKSRDEIPPRIGYDTMEKAKSRFRIRMSNVMIIAALGLCGFYVWQGKKRLREGDTIKQRIMDRDNKILEEYRKKQNG